MFFEDKNEYLHVHSTTAKKMSKKQKAYSLKLHVSSDGATARGAKFFSDKLNLSLAPQKKNKSVKICKFKKN